MPNMGGWEWVIVLVIVLLVFGVGRVGQLGKELGEGIKAFRQGIREGQGTDDEEEVSAEHKST